MFPPKTLINGNGSTSPLRPTNAQPHSIGINLSVSLEDSLTLDDPMGYFYAVRLIDEGDPTTGEFHNVPDDKPESEKWAGSEMEVKANAMRYAAA